MSFANGNGTEIVISTPLRTAIGTFGGALKDVPAVDLGTTVAKEVISRSGIDVEEINQVIVGNILMAGQGMNPARQVGINAGVPETSPAMTLNRMCASGLQAIVSAAQEIALALPADAWTTITWREGSTDPLTSRFARLRVRAAHRDYHLGEPRPEEGRLVQWPPEVKGPTKYWLSTIPEDIPFDRLVALAKLRWRIERDYQELKQELGLGHYEGRSWRGFHHHATLCIAAYAFLVAERATISPSGREAAQRTTSRLPASDRPRGAPDQAGASRAELDRDRATTAYNRLGPQP